MRFQVLSSQVGYSHSCMSSLPRLAINFSVFPCPYGELNFSDGNRIVGGDIYRKWGEPLTYGDIQEAIGENGDPLANEKKSPASVDISISKRGSEPEWIKSDEFAKGVAIFFKDSLGNNDARLGVELYVEAGYFEEVLRLCTSRPTQTYFDVDIRGIGDRAYHREDGPDGTWDLNDVSDCGKGNCRIVTDFSFSRQTSYFPDGNKEARRQKERLENEGVQKRLQSTIHELVAIGNGQTVGPVEHVLRWNTNVLILIAIIEAILTGVLIIGLVAKR